MSFQAMAWAAQQKCPNSISTLVLLMLANYADDRHQPFPSYKKLAQLCACNERTVMRAINQLKELGFITVTKRYGEDGKQTSNSFTLDVRGDKSHRVGVTKTTPNTIRDIQDNNKGDWGDKYTSDFQEWWHLYPRKDGSKAKAFEGWKKATSKFIDVAELLSATGKFKQSCQGKERAYIPHATTWLNQKRWETVSIVDQATSNRNQLAG